LGGFQERPRSRPTRSWSRPARSIRRTPMASLLPSRGWMSRSRNGT